MSEQITRIVKRDGTVEDFKFDKFVNAIMGAVIDAGGDPNDDSQAEYLAAEARSYLTEYIAPVGGTATVEECQWAIFKTLVEKGHAKVAQAFQRLTPSQLLNIRTMIPRLFDITNTTTPTTKE